MHEDRRLIIHQIVRNTNQYKRFQGSLLSKQNSLLVVHKQANLRLIVLSRIKDLDSNKYLWDPQIIILAYKLNIYKK